MANNRIPQFLKMNGEAAEFNADGELHIYVPELFFRSSYAFYSAEYLNLLGILNYTLVDKNGKNNGLHTFNLPTVFLSQPSEIEKVKGVRLKQYMDPEDYRILKYRKGDKVIVQVEVPEVVDNVEEFFKLFALTGHVPTSIPYPIIYEYFFESMELNGENYGINAQLFGIMQSELCRDPSDRSRPFRLSKAKKEGRMNDYIPISLKEIPKYVSPYVNLTSENWDDSMVQSIMMDENKIKSTPLEKIMMT